MDSPVHIDVASLDSTHRRAFEDVLGRALAANEQLVVHIEPTSTQTEKNGTPSLIDLIEGFYAGMADDEIEEIDRAIKLRANLTRLNP